jgi:hypothetical protein
LISYIGYVSGVFMVSPLLDNIEFDLTLSLLSALIFLVVCICSTFNRAFYFIILPIVVLNIPNAINDLSLSFWAGPVMDRGRATFPVFSHIDFFLLMGIFRLMPSGSGAMPFLLNSHKIIFKSVLVIFISLIIGWLVGFYSDGLSSLLFFGNSFQLRYLLYICIFIRLVNTRDIDFFIIGLSIASVLVIFEAIIYTYLYGHANLTSGNFGTNTLGVLLGFLFLILKNYSQTSGIVRFFLLSFLFLALFMTGTKAAIIGIIFVYFIDVTADKISSFAWAGITAFMLILVGFLNYELLQDLIVPLKLFIETPDYSSLIEQDMVGGPLSSALTRLSLWWTSFNILSEYPMGIGSANFNYLKVDNGFLLPIFIDPHSDYIYSFVQYGWLGGMVFLGLVYGYPLVRIKYDHVNYKSYLIRSPLFFLLLTSVSNSNLNKHQLFFIVIFCLFIVINKYNSKGNKNPPV